MVIEDYVSFEVARLLKDKGFNNPTLAYAYSNGMMSYYSRPRITDPLSVEAGKIPMPTLQMAMKWLREVHNLIIEIRVKHHFRIFDGYYVGIVHLDGDVHYKYTPNDYLTYEEACEAAIKYCLENLI